MKKVKKYIYGKKSFYTNNHVNIENGKTTTTDCRQKKFDQI